MRLPSAGRRLMWCYRRRQLKKEIEDSREALVQQGGCTPHEAETIIQARIAQLPVWNGGEIRIQRDDGRIYKL